MATTIEISDEFYDAAKKSAAQHHRSVPKQIEHWAKLARVAEDNPDLPLEFIQGLLEALEDVKNGDVTEYKFGDYNEDH